MSLLDSILFPTLSALAAGRGSAKSEPYLQALQTTRPIELDCRRRSGCSVVGNIQNLEESSLGTVARRTPCSRLRTHSRATDYLARQLSVAWQGTPRAKAQGQIGRQDIPQASPTSSPEVPLLIHQRKLSSPRCSPLLSDDSDIVYQQPSQCPRTHPCYSLAECHPEKLSSSTRAGPCLLPVLHGWNAVTKFETSIQNGAGVCSQEVRSPSLAPTLPGSKKCQKSVEPEGAQGRGPSPRRGSRRRRGWCVTMTRGRTEAGQIHCPSKLGEASILRGRYIECIVERILSSRRIFRVAGQDQVEPGLVTVKLDTWQHSLAELAVGGHWRCEDLGER